MLGLFCLIRGGHHWQTARDGAGHLTSCARCGAQRHLRTRPADDASFLMHTDVAAEFSRRDSHGSEEAAASPGSPRDD